MNSDGNHNSKFSIFTFFQLLLSSFSSSSLHRSILFLPSLSPLCLFFHPHSLRCVLSIFKAAFPERFIWPLSMPCGGRLFIYLLKSSKWERELAGWEISFSLRVHPLEPRRKRRMSSTHAERSGVGWGGSFARGDWVKLGREWTVYSASSHVLVHPQLRLLY